MLPMSMSGESPRTWFYDAFLFLMFGGAPSGATYIDGATTRADWEHFLNVTFARDRRLDALDQEDRGCGPAPGQGRPGLPGHPDDPLSLLPVRRRLAMWTAMAFRRTSRCARIG